MSSRDTDPKMMVDTDKSALSRLRLLDFDDLFLLGHLLEGHTIAATAKLLGLTQPAITQRVRKIERVFEEPILQKAGRHVKLTPEGHAVCVKAADALALMRAVTTETQNVALAVGAAPALGSRWLWPALLELRGTMPQHPYHVVLGEEDNLLAMFEGMRLDACLTTKAPSHLPALELGEEEFLMVAAPALAAEITDAHALAKHVLLEIDRSYPLLARLNPTSRAAVRFRDVWFGGAEAHLVQAACLGHGLAILPEAAVQAALLAGKLTAVLPELVLEPLKHRLIYRPGPGVEPLIQRLAQALLRLRPKAQG